MAKRVSPRTPSRSTASPRTPARAWLLRTTALLPIAFGTAAGAQTVAPNAGPTGGQVVAGQASIATAPNRTTVTQTTDRGVINWQQFNVGSQHTVQFQQPNAASWTLNRVVTSDPSVIAGRIQANGGIAIVNQSGIVFSQGAQVDVGSLIASAPGITNENFMAGRMRFDQAARPGARVENRGRVTVPDRGIAVLAGPRVTNSGEIHARLGRVVLAGAETYALDLAGDGLISIDITQAVRGDGTAIVTNEGVIEANGGNVLLTASAAGDLIEGLVRNTGRISANTEAGRTGEVALRATGGGVEVTGTVTATGGAGQSGGRIAVQSGESVRVAAGAALDASGGAGGGTVLVGTTGVGRNQTMARRTTVERGATIRADATVLGQGGTIAINSTEMTTVEGALTARGGPQGGDGGLIELSGQGRMNLYATWDASAPAGQAGSLLLDPVRIEVNDFPNPGQAIPGTGDTIIATDGQGSNTLQLNAGQLSSSTGNIILEAQLGIRVTRPVTKTQGDLTLRTTEAAGTSGLDGISIEAPITLGTGSFAASTAGTFAIASGGSVTATGPTIQIDATGGITLGGALVGFSVTLNANGDITQTAAGLVSAGNLTVRATAAEPDGAAPNLRLDQANNFILGLDAQVDGALAVTRAGGDDRPLTVLQAAAGGDISLLANAGFSVVVADGAGGGSGIASGGNVTLRGDSITVNNSVAGGPGTVVAFELRDGGALTGTGAISTTGGTVRIAAAVGDETAFRIADSGTASSISVSSQTLGQITAGTLAIGRTADNSATATSITIGADVAPQAGTLVQMEAAAGDIDVNANITGTGVVLSANGAITLGTGGSIDAGGGALILFALGAVTQNSGTTINAGSLAVLGAGGIGAAASVNLNQSGNTIGEISQIRATGDVTINAGTGADPLAVGTIATGPTGNVTLSAARAISLDGDITAAGIAVTATATAPATTADITQTAGNITATGTLTFQSDGAVSQTGGTITADSLSVLGATGGSTAAASIDLGQAGNAIAALDQVRATTDMTIQAGAGALSIGTGAVVSGANITLIATGDITQSAGTINAGSGAGSLTFQSDGAVSQTGGDIRAGSLSVLGAIGGTSAAASIDLGQADNAIAAIGQIRVSGDIAIHAGTGSDPFSIGAIATATGDVALSAARAIEVIGAVSGVNLIITGTAITVGATGQVTATGGDLILHATSEGGGITFDASSRLTGASGSRVVLRADTLSIDAGAALTLTATAVEIGPQTEDRIVRLGTTGGGLSLDVVTLDRLTGSGATSLRIGETTIDGTPARGGPLSLLTDLSFTTGDLTLVSSGAVALGGNDITTTGHDLRIHATDAVSGSGALQAASLTIRGSDGADAGEAGAITLNGAGSAVTLLDLRSNAAIVFANTGGPLTVRQASGISVAIDAAGQAVTVQAIGAGGHGIAATGDISLRAASIALGAGITVDGGHTLSLQTGSISGAGVLSASNGTIAIGPAAAGDALTIGGSGIATSVISAAQADTLVIGGSSFNGEAAITAGSVTVTQAVNLTNAGTLTLQASGDITQNSGALITAATLSASAGGNIQLDAGDSGLTGLVSWNQIGTLGNVTAGGSFLLNANGPLIIAGAIQAGSAIIASKGTLTLNGAITLAGAGPVQLAATGAITLNGSISAGGGMVTLGSAAAITQNPSSTITADRFGALGTSITLNGTDNDLGPQAQRATTGNLEFDTIGTLTLTSVLVAMVGGPELVSGLSTPGDLTISADAIIDTGGAEFRAGNGRRVTLRTDQLNLAAGSVIDAIFVDADGNGLNDNSLSQVSIGPRTPGQAVVIGAADTADTLGLSGVTLDRLGSVTAPLQIGLTTLGGTPVLAGDIRVEAALNAGQRLSLVSGGTISLSGMVSTATGDIVLAATDGITQAASGGLAPGSGRLVASADGDIVLTAGNNSFTLLAAESSGGAVRAAANGTLTTGSGTGLSPQDGSATAIASVQAATDILLQASSLVITQPISAAAVTLRADSMAIAAAVDANGGTVLLEQLTAGRGIWLGAENLAALSLSTTELALVDASLLVIGRSDGGQIAVAGNVAAPADLPTLRLVGSGMTVTASLTAGSIEAWIGGSGMSGSGLISANSLTVRGLTGGADGGPVTLTSQAQRIDALDILSAGAVSLALDAQGGTIQANQIQGSSVTVSVIDGGLTVPNGGSVSADSVSISVIGGGLTVASGGSVSAGSINLTASNIDAVAIDGVVLATAGDLAITGGSVTLSHDITVANGNATVTVTGGDATLDADITARAIALSATGAMTVNGAMQATAGDLTITGGSVIVTRDVTVANGAARIRATTGDATLNGDISARTVELTTEAGTMNIGGTVTATAGDATLTATLSGITVNNAISAAAGNVVINAGQTLVLDANITAATTGSVTLQASGITQDGGVIGGASGDTTRLAIVAGAGGATLEHANRIATLNATATGALSIVSTDALTVERAIGAGSVTLSAAALHLTGAVGAAGGTVDLTATIGSVTQTAAGIITAQTLTGDVAEDVALATAANAVAQTGAFTFGRDFALRSGGNLAVTSALTASPGRTIALQADSNLVLQAAVAADTVSLAATTGGISQTAAGRITAASLTATAGTGVLLTAGDAQGDAVDAWNRIGTLAGGDGGSGEFLLRNTGSLTVAGPVRAGTTLRLDTTGSFVLDANGALRTAAGGTVVLASSGPVTLAGLIDAGQASIASSGLIRQSGGGITTAGLLAARAADIDLQAAGNAIGQLAARATSGDVAVTSTGTMTVTSATGIVLHGGQTRDIAGVSGTTVLLAANGLNIAQAVAADPGNTVTLRADSMAIAAAVTASNGAVLLEQATPGTRGISLGAENAGALSLTTAELANIGAATLVIGRGDGGPVTIAGDVAVSNSIGTLRLLGSGIGVNALLAGPASGVTELQAVSGSITTAGAGRVAGRRLVASAAAGDIALTGQNDFAEVTGSAPGSFAYRDANGFTVAAPGIQAAGVSLSTDAGNITQQAGAAIIAGALAAQAAAGSVLLDGGAADSTGADLNRIGAVSRLVASASGLARLRNAQGFDMAGLADNGAGGSLGTLQLFAATGSITQSAGAIRAARLEATTPGGSLQLEQANAIAALGTSRIAGDLAITNASSLTLTGPVDVGSFGGGSSGTAALTVTNGNLLQTAGARLSADRLAVNALNGSAVLDGGGSANPADLLRVGTLVSGYAAQSMVLRFGNAIAVTGLLQAGATSGTPTGTLALEAPGITIGSPGQGGTLLRAGTVVLRTQADFDGPAIPGSGSIVQQGGAIEAVNLAASAPDGDVLLGLAGNRFNALAPGFSANGTTSTHSLVAGGSIDIAEGGPGFIVLGGLQNDGGLIQLRSLGNLTFNAATTVSGPIELLAAGTVTIGSAADLRSDATLTLNGGGIAVQGAVTATDIVATTSGAFSLTSGGFMAGGAGAGGSVSVTAGHVATDGGTITAHDITLQTGTGTIVNTGFAAQNLVDIRAGGALQVSGISVNADAMQARTSGFLTVAGGSYTIGRVVVFAGSGGITMDAAAQVRPRIAGTFPAVVLDSRTPGSQPDPLAIVRPDIAGLAPDLQETQVRLPNTDAPGDFGAASSAPAGPIHFSLDAGQSPLFLLIDGGSVTGTVNTSGRIGIHGRGGSVDLVGTIIDPSGQRIEGQAAARLTDATRPATGTELSSYRINDCVVSSFNCVTPSQVIVVPNTALPPPPLVYGGVGRDPDTVSPNVSEEWTAPGDDEEDDKR